MIVELALPFNHVPLQMTLAKNIAKAMELWNVFALSSRWHTNIDKSMLIYALKDTWLILDEISPLKYILLMPYLQL